MSSVRSKSLEQERSCPAGSRQPYTLYTEGISDRDSPLEILLELFLENSLRWRESIAWKQDLPLYCEIHLYCRIPLVAELLTRAGRTITSTGQQAVSRFQMHVIATMVGFLSFRIDISSQMCLVGSFIRKSVYHDKYGMYSPLLLYHGCFHQIKRYGR